MGMVFNNFIKFPDLWVVKIHLLMSYFDICSVMRMIFRKNFPDLWVKSTSQKILQIYEWYFTPYLGNSSDPLPDLFSLSSYQTFRPG